MAPTKSSRSMRRAASADPPTERRGKTAGLNLAVPTLTGDIVVFSDANAMYQPDALLKLVRNFADPEVGCVTGEARYLPAAAAPPMSASVSTGTTRS